MFAYMFVGVAGGVAYLRLKSVVWRSIIWLVLGAVPGAFGGAFLLQLVADLVIKLVMYILILMTSTLSLYRLVMDARPITAARDDGEKPIPTIDSGKEHVATDRDGESMPISMAKAAEVKQADYETARGRSLRVVLGLLVGFSSALTGTSGPVCLLPVLMILRWEVLQSLG